MKQVSSFPPHELHPSPSTPQGVGQRRESEWEIANQTIGQVELQPFVQVRADAPVRQAVQTLHGSRVPTLLVVEEGKCVGLLSERDVLEKVAEQFAKCTSKPIRDFMSRDPILLCVSDSLTTALEMIAQTDQTCIPVVSDDGRLIGTLSPTALLRFLDERMGDGLSLSERMA